ncbi:APC family permease [Paludibacterium paludis]|uniref:Amino acid transporter n=1 Tax=Paludibacterium paludis TaxID=1225769 RepID=A0A918P6I0_9NEIS|nr:APC family permease [Paludibacterium paludis]GGY26225.1 amino acid transporter [Paludibacterium paludis]
MKEARVLTVTDIVVMNVVSIVSLRHIAGLASYGASAMVMWLMAACCLFLPMAMVCGELSTIWASDGGMFIWVREAFGKRIGWMVVAFYALSCLLYFPLMLQYALSTLAVALGGNLADHSLAIALASIAIFWLLTGLNILGMQWTRHINRFSMLLGVFIPVGILVVLAVVWLASGRTMQTPYPGSMTQWMPDMRRMDAIVYLSSTMFAFAGLEVAPMVAGRTRHPQRDFPRAILVSAVLIMLFYMVGTWCLNILHPSDNIDIVAGVAQALILATRTFGIPWLLPLMAVCLMIGTLGQVNAWMVGQIVMLQEASREYRILGTKITENHPVHGTPANALLAQAVIVTGLCLLALLSPSVQAAYWEFASLTMLCYFVPYLSIFAAYLRLLATRATHPRSFRIPGRILPVALPVVGLLAVLFSMVLCLVPPANLTLAGDLFTFAGKHVLTLFAVWLAADRLYRHATRRTAPQTAPGSPSPGR